MNTNRRARHFIGHQRFAIVASSLLFVTGCPQQPAPEDGEQDMSANHANHLAGHDMNNGGEDMGEVVDGQDMNTTPPVDDDMGGDMGDVEGGEVALRFEAVEWGLLSDGAPLPSSIEQRSDFEEDAPTFTVELPAGMWRVQVDRDGQSWTLPGDGTPTGLERRDGEALVAASDAGRGALLFSALDEQLSVSVTDAGELTIARASASAQADPDALGRPSGTVGPLFDEAIYRINTEEDDAAVVLDLMDALREVGAGPVASSQGIFFIAPYDNLGGEAGAPQARGDFNEWGAVNVNNSRMRSVVGELWGRFLPLEAGRYQYKLAYPGLDGNDNWFTDRSNRHIRWDGFDPGTIGAFNSILDVGSPTAEGSRMVWWAQVESQVLGNTREVYIHLPASYDEDENRRYPVLYVQDGNESIVRSQFHQVADDHAAQGNAEVILVFVALPTQEDRFPEYTMASDGARGDVYTEFLAKELVPMIDAVFRTRAEAKARGLVGASLGGLISFWTALQYSETFEYTAGMSSSFFWEDQFMIREVERRGCQGLRYYIDSGSPNDNADVTRLMRDKLDELGCTFEHVEETGGTHDWSFWKGRFPNVLRTFEQSHR